ncbi:glycosyltransferase [Rhizobium sp. BK251]|uniref:glycosyltransferase n=1 Tax=Rhizobium sp. BK251 TaxID=2512125 RepID=UPI001047C379|nr:glycosyltransferase [Rhizobium sp. BK251]TCL72983.1 glycosyltransferase involved in cell wall biosynthesis [Rhizobium sp. BK251]
MNKKLSVCFSIATISRNGAGVAESARLQSLYLEKDNSTEISVVTLKDEHFSTDAPYWNGVSMTSHRAWGPSILGFSPLVFFSLLRERPDLVHVHGIWQFHCLSVWFWSILTGGTYVVSPHGMLEPWIRARSPLLKKLISKLYHDRFLRASDAIHLLTAKERKDVAEFLTDQPVKIIPNYVLPIENDKQRPSWWRPGFDNCRIFLFFGRIHEKKGCRELCDAWEALCASDKTFRESSQLVFCGWNDGLAGFEQRIAALYARFGNIHFPGPQYGLDKNRSLSNASVLVLPSKSEGLPMTVLEAWSAGLPVIMTEECNLPEGFAAGAALRTRTDVISLKQSLKQASGMEQTDLARMAANGKALVADKYSITSAGRALLDLYEDAQQHRASKTVTLLQRKKNY